MEGNKKEKAHKRRKEGGIIMTLEKALAISSEEFVNLSKECKGFNDEVYKNHQVHKEGESIGEFLIKGSYRITANPVIKGKLGDDNRD